MTDAAVPNPASLPTPGSAASDAPRSTLPALPLWAAAGGLAALACVAHYLLVDIPNRLEQLEWHRQIVTNTGYYPDQYRILTYVLAEGLIRLGVPFTLAHELLRFGFTAGALVLLTRCLEVWLPRPWPAIGLLMAALVLPSTYLFYHLQPTDPLNWLIFCAAVLLLVRGWDWALVPLVAVGALNRETVLVLPVLQALVRWGHQPVRRWLPVTLSALAVGFAVYFGLRLVLGMHPPYASESVRHYWRRNLYDPRTWWQLLIFFNLTLVFGAWRFWRRPEFLRRAALLVPMMLAIYVSVGYLRETRYLLPLLPVTLPITLLGLREWLVERSARTR
jgi:hypothetical protein